MTSSELDDKHLEDDWGWFVIIDTEEYEPVSSIKHKTKNISIPDTIYEEPNKKAISSLNNLQLKYLLDEQVYYKNHGYERTSFWSLQTTCIISIITCIIMTI